MSNSDKHIQEVVSGADKPADATQEKTLEPDLPPDRTRQFTHTNFSRMRTEWRDEQQPMLAVVRGAADRIVRDEFRVAYAVLGRIRKTVRIQLVDQETGEALYNEDGSPQWEKDEFGVPAEDWSALTGDREMLDDLLWTVTTWLYEFEQKAAAQWAEAMYAKVDWEQAFAYGFKALPGESLSRPTIDDRTQAGHRASADERYFAVFKSVLSRHADAVVRSLTRIQWLLEKSIDR